MQIRSICRMLFFSFRSPINSHFVSLHFCKSTVHLLKSVLNDDLINENGKCLIVIKTVESVHWQSLPFITDLFVQYVHES